MSRAASEENLSFSESVRPRPRRAKSEGKEEAEERKRLENEKGIFSKSVSFHIHNQYYFNFPECRQNARDRRATEKPWRKNMLSASKPPSADGTKSNNKEEVKKSIEDRPRPWRSGMKKQDAAQDNNTAEKKEDGER